MSQLKKRIAELEQSVGLGRFGDITKEVLYSTDVTGDVFECLGETWTRGKGEDDHSLRKRALEDLLRNDRRTLIIRLCQNVAEAMWLKSFGREEGETEVEFKKRVRREKTYGHAEKN